MKKKLLLAGILGSLAVIMSANEGHALFESCSGVDFNKASSAMGYFTQSKYLINGKVDIARIIGADSAGKTSGSTDKANCSRAFLEACPGLIKSGNAGASGSAEETAGRMCAIIWYAVKGVMTNKAKDAVNCLQKVFNNTKDSVDLSNIVNNAPAIQTAWNTTLSKGNSSWGGWYGIQGPDMDKAFANTKYMAGYVSPMNSCVK